MKTTFEEKRSALFTIEKITSVPSSLSQLSGCALCGHCTLLRLRAQSSLDRGDGSCPRPLLAHEKEYK